MTTPKVYLAGPGVFRPDAAAFAATLKQLCDAHGLDPLWPLDNEIAADADRSRMADHIRRANEAMIRAADAVIADVSPFRGPNMDPGTAYEIGFAVALAKPVFAWTDDPRVLLARTPADATRGGGDVSYDRDGLVIEDFGLIENLMIATAVHGIAPTVREAVAACARHLGKAAS